MKSLHSLFFVIFLLTAEFSFSQPDTILYFGQEPPGNSATIFAPDSISLSTRKELKITFSPDGQECIFGISTGSIFKLMRSTVTGVHWSDPEPIDFPNTSFEREPMISPNGNKLYFAAPQSSTVEQWVTDIWMSEKNGDEWSDPVRLSGQVNSNSEEWHPSLTSDETIYFCSKRSGRYYLYRSIKTGESYEVAEKLPEVINPAQSGASDPYIAPDESYLIFTFGATNDQCISYHKEDGTWTNPKVLGSDINTNGTEYGSFVSYDSNYYFFSRIGDYGLKDWGDIYWVNADFIDGLKHTNFAPYVLSPIPDMSVTVNSLFSYTIPDSVFIDDDGNETLTFTAALSNGNDLPDSLTFIPGTMTLSGKLKETGSFEIKITATDTAGASASDIFIITDIEETVKINKDVTNDELMVYPNPAGHTIQIRSEDLAGIKDYTILNLNGKMIKQETFNTDIIDIEELDPGFYILKLHTDNGYINRKLVVE